MTRKKKRLDPIDLFASGVPPLQLVSNCVLPQIYSTWLTHSVWRSAYNWEHSGHIPEALKLPSFQPVAARIAMECIYSLLHPHMLMIKDRSMPK